MRILLLLTLGFGAACVSCVYLLPAQLFLFIGLVFLVSSLGLVLIGRQFRLFRIIALLLLGVSVGMVWNTVYRNGYLEEAFLLDGRTQQAVVRTSDFSYSTAYGSAVDGVVERKGKSYQVRVYLDDTAELSPGTILEGTFRFRVTTGDGAMEQTHHPGKGIFLLAYQRGDVTASETPLQTLREKASLLRRRIETILNETFPSDTRPFAKALLMGITDELDYQTDTALKISGIRHVVAVSGLHVSILFALLSAVTFRRRFLRMLAGVPVLLLFAAVAGFTPSVNRACLMSGLMLAGSLLDREYDGLTALSFAALVMMVLNPMVITSVSFQLSFASVAGIFLFEPKIRSWLTERIRTFEKNTIRDRLRRWFISSVSVSVGAVVLTTPLCAWYFGMVSLISVLTNLLCLWIISSIFIGIIVVCLISLFWQSAAVFLAKILSWPVRYVLFMSGLLAKLPLAAVYTQSEYITGWLVFMYCLLFVFLLSREKKPLTLACCTVLGLCLSLLASWAEPMTADCSIRVLDVGQGQCVLLQSQGRTFLVDCGGDSDSASADLAAATLLSEGVWNLDGMILTHLDDDHAAGAEKLLTRMETDLLILPPEHTQLGADSETQRLFVSEDIRIQWGSTELTVFAPDFPGNGNENSLCILFDTEKCDILITGDRSGFGERMLLRFHTIPDVDVLVAGHHGSKNSTCEELLQAVKPEIVCISVGKDNSYGHPAPELLQRLDQYGCTVYRTDENGTITIRR